MSSPHEGRQTGLISAAPLGIVVAAGVASLIFQFFVFPSDLTSTDWKEAAQSAIEKSSPKDAIMVHPDWTEQPLPYLRDFEGDLLRNQNPNFSDLYGVDSVWILTPKARRADALDRLPFAPSEAKVQSHLASSPVTVLRVEPPESPTLTTSLLDELEDAQVTRIPPEAEPRGCKNWTPEQRRWDCGKRDSWLYVGREFLFVDGAPRTCIWAHPLPDQKQLRIEFDSIQFEDELWVRHGLSLEAARSDRGSQIQFDVSVEGSKRSTRTVPPRTTKWRKERIDTAELTGTKGTVTIEIRAKSLYDRFFCFNGWTVDT